MFDNDTCNYNQNKLLNGASNEPSSCISGCSNRKGMQEVCHVGNQGIDDPFPINYETFSSSYQDDKQLDLGSFLDYVSSSPKIIESSSSIENNSNQENLLKRPIIEIYDDEPSDYRPLSCSSNKRSRWCNDASSPNDDGNDDALIVTPNNKITNVQDDEGLPRFRDYQEDKWQMQLAALVEFRKKNGHCCVPNKCDENPMLGRWVS